METSNKRLVCVAVGAKGKPLTNLINTPLDCKKTPISNIKMHLILDRIGYLLFDVIH